MNHLIKTAGSNLSPSLRYAKLNYDLKEYADGVPWVLDTTSDPEISSADIAATILATNPTNVLVMSTKVADVSLRLRVGSHRRAVNLITCPAAFSQQQFSVEYMRTRDIPLVAGVAFLYPLMSLAGFTDVFQAFTIQHSLRRIEHRSVFHDISMDYSFTVHDKKLLAFYKGSTTLLWEPIPGEGRTTAFYAKKINALAAQCGWGA